MSIEERTLVIKSRIKECLEQITYLKSELKKIQNECAKNGHDSIRKDNGDMICRRCQAIIGQCLDQIKCDECKDFKDNHCSLFSMSKEEFKKYIIEHRIEAIA